MDFYDFRLHYVQFISQFFREKLIFHAFVIFRFTDNSNKTRQIQIFAVCSANIKAALNFIYELDQKPFVIMQQMKKSFTHNYIFQFYITKNRKKCNLLNFLHHSVFFGFCCFCKAECLRIESF